jgi:hypothetical protein
MKFLMGLVIGAVISCGAFSLYAQNERAMHPRIAHAIEALKDARAYMQQAPHDFGGHKASAIRATNEAIHELEQALRYRGRVARR